MIRTSFTAVALSSTLAAAAASTSVPAPAKAPAQSSAKPSANFVAGQVVRVMRASPVFKEPRKQSKVLADADVGTTLILKKTSPRGLWLELEDEDGNAGWVPANRTDFSPVPSPPSAPGAKSPQTEEEEEPEPTNVSERGGSPTEEASARMRWLAEARGGLTAAGHDLGANRSAGAGLSALFPAPTSPTGKLSWVGFSLGGEALLSSAGYEGLVVPVRYRQWSRYAGAAWAFGPDFGVLRYVLPRSSDATSLEVGYGGGWSGSSISLTLRAGLRFVHGTRFHLGIACGFEL